MKYSDRSLQELAAAHALGTLRGRARARFERLCRDLPAADAARRHWEDRLLPLALATPAQRVAALGWSAIRLRLEELTPSHGTAHTAPVRVPRWVAAACIVGLALLFGQVLLQSRPDWRPVATLTPPNGVPQWRIARSADFTRLRVETLGEVVAPDNRSYELWVLPAAGGNPVSLGIITSQGLQERVLDARQQQLLMTAQNVAVSLEPGGGSRNGLPTQVLFAAPVSTAG
jgi:anti-sigma-K factor RskA